MDQVEALARMSQQVTDNQGMVLAMHTAMEALLRVAPDTDLFRQEWNAVASLMSQSLDTNVPPTTTGNARLHAAFARELAVLRAAAFGPEPTAPVVPLGGGR